MDYQLLDSLLVKSSPPSCWLKSDNLAEAWQDHDLQTDMSELNFNYFLLTISISS